MAELNTTIATLMESAPISLTQTDQTQTKSAVVFWMDEKLASIVWYDHIVERDHCVEGLVTHLSGEERRRSKPKS